MAENRPLVSIIVRTKDRPKLLKRAMQSISAQTYRPIEVVLVNDGGCDLDIEAFKGLLGDISLNYIKLEKNAGRAHAGNVGIENTKGTYVGFLDDDDEFFLEHVETLVTFLEHSDYKVAYADTEMSYQDFAPEEGRVADMAEVVFSKDFSYYDLLVGNYIPFNSILFSKDALGRFSIDESLDLYEDWDLLIRIAGAYPFYHIKKLTTRYNQWNRDLQINRAKAEHMIELHRAIIWKHRDAISPDVILHLKHEKERSMAEVKIQNTRCLELEHKIIGLDAAIRERDVRYASFENELKDKDRRIADAEAALADKDRRIADAEAALADKGRRIALLEQSITLMQNTRGWRALEKMRKGKDRVFPPGSRRKKTFDLMLRGSRVLREEGPHAFFVKVSRKLRWRGIAPHYPPSFAPMHFSDATPKPVHIIIPIYNGFECVVPCIESVCRHTDLDFHSLSLVDDKSPDTRIREYLSAFDKKAGNIEIRFNNENLGFTKTVNAEMRRTVADVILLNADTIVTEGWVKKLQRAAYSRLRVATVTPFSNNATHCSIPFFLKENPVPEGYSIDTFAGFIEKIALRYYPEIPTAVGFCMFIRRDALDRAGYFDEATFGKGYGEECEFCARTRRLGFSHLLDDATYVYHEGSVSFSPEVRTEVVDKRLRIIDDLYPEFLPAVNDFYGKNGLRMIHDYINFRMQLAR